MMRAGMALAALAPFALWESRGPIDSLHADQAWRAFVERSELTRALVTEGDVESYDADNHALVLTAEASRTALPRFHHYVVLLGAERVSGGLRIEPYSARWIGHPVVFVERIEERSVLLFRPGLGVASEAAWQAIAPGRLESHFAGQGRLSRPRSEPAYRDLEARVQRISQPALSATDAGLVLEYTLSGRHVGRYLVRVSLALVHGNTSASLLGRGEEPLELASGSVRRRVVFGWDELARVYGPNAETSPFREAGSVWRAMVVLKPALADAELAQLGLLERERLHGGPGVGTSALGHMERAELAVDRSRLRRR